MRILSESRYRELLDKERKINGQKRKYQITFTGGSKKIYEATGWKILADDWIAFIRDGRKIAIHTNFTSVVEVEEN